MPFESEEGDLQKLNIIVQLVFFYFKLFYVAPFLLTFKQTLYFFSWCIQWYKKCWNRWKNKQVMPFKSEEGDSQKLNITI
jgi:hypothetical protein